MGIGVLLTATAGAQAPPETCSGSCGIPDQSVFYPRLSISPMRRAVVDLDLDGEPQSRTVSIRLQRRDASGAWRTTATARRSDPEGAIHVRFSARLHPGTYRARSSSPVFFSKTVKVRKG